MKHGSHKCLDEAVDAWTLESVVASLYLAMFYRRIGDGGQASAALRAGTPSTERLRRQGRDTELSTQVKAFTQAHPDENQAEEAAWHRLLTALGGITAFLAIMDGGENCPGLRSPRHAFAKAFGAALKGYRAGFPDCMVAVGIGKAEAEAVNTCESAYLACLDEQDPDLRADLAGELRRIALEAIRMCSDAEPAKGMAAAH